MSLFLNNAEIYELTGRKRHDAQHTQLNRMGIVHKIRADGLPIVLRSHIDKEFAGQSTHTKESEPNWGAVNG